MKEHRVSEPLPSPIRVLSRVLGFPITSRAEERLATKSIASKTRKERRKKGGKFGREERTGDEGWQGGISSCEQVRTASISCLFPAAWTAVAAAIRADCFYSRFPVPRGRMKNGGLRGTEKEGKSLVRRFYRGTRAIKRETALARCCRGMESRGAGRS